MLMFFYPVVHLEGKYEHWQTEQKDKHWSSIEDHCTPITALFHFFNLPFVLLVFNRLHRAESVIVAIDGSLRGFLEIHY